MTRWARGGDANKRKPHDASSWEELKQDIGKHRNQRGDAVRKRHTLNEKGKQVKKNVSRTGSVIRNKVKPKIALATLDSTSDGKQKVSTNEATSSSSKETSTLYEPSSSSKSLVDTLLETDSSGNVARRVGMERGDSAEDSEENKESVKTLWKKEKRSEERRLKRQKRKMESMVCFHCRQPGHGVADCPQMLQDIEQGTGICFRCGSTEHDIRKCTAKVDKKLGEFPYAKCFICQQTGHLSRTCPDNPRGLYPEGGGCKECGSVEHRWWNCPIKKPVKGVDIEVSDQSGKRSNHMSADAEPAFMSKQKAKVKKTGPKVVVF